MYFLFYNILVIATEEQLRKKFQRNLDVNYYLSELGDILEQHFLIIS